MNFDKIDTVTGEVVPIVTFHSDYRSSQVQITSNSIRISSNPREYYSVNEDYSLMTAVQRYDSGETHVGWIDSNGNFTDITAKVVGEKSDFSGLTRHDRPTFYQGYLYYVDYTTENYGNVLRVPLDNISEETVDSY